MFHMPELQPEGTWKGRLQGTPTADSLGPYSLLHTPAILAMIATSG